MPTPVNYVDLFDRLYPEQHLAGLTDDGQINTEELNRRYATIRANQRTMLYALNSIYSAQPGGAHFKDYMLPYWEVAAVKKFDLTPSKIVSLRYRAGFDPGGESLTFPENRTGLHLHDLGSDLLNQMTEVSVYVDGRLIAPSKYHIHAAQGGFSIYVVETEVGSGATTAHVVLLRKFNQAGVTRGAAVVRTCQATTAQPFDIIVPSLSELGNVYDVRYYKLFHKVPGDRWFRPVDEALVGYRASAVGDGAVFTKMDGAMEDEEFVVVCTAEFWKFEFDGALTENSNASVINLIDQYGLPAPVSRIEDLDVYVDGRLQRPNVDYWINWGSVEGYRHPPKLVLRHAPTGVHRHVLARTNAPYDPEFCPELREDEITDPYAIYRMPQSERALRLIEDVGLSFSGGYLVNCAEGINVVADNLGLHIDDLPDTRDLYFRARFVLTPAAIHGALSESEHMTALEQFVTLVGLRADGTSADGNSLMSFDFIQSYKLNAGAQPIPDAPRPYPTSLFPAMYFWARDDQAEARFAGEVVDCRDDPAVGDKDGWQQDGTTYMDCRPLEGIDAGYITDRPLDCREV